ncbi:MAG: translation elongation factor Ts [Candidatus Melainabacteria bacterium]
MTITAAQVKELRERTGCGMMDAKKALEEAAGDMEKAGEILRQRGIATAEKKSNRAAADGQVVALVADDKKSGVLVEINCETDFVAKGDAFQALTHDVVNHIAAEKPESLEALVKQPSKVMAGQTVQDYITDKIASIKENITVRRFVRYELKSPGAIHAYIHTGGKIGVLLELVAGSDATPAKPEFQQLLKDVAMQIASSSPEFVTRDDISPEVIEAETRVEMGKEDLQSKPEEIRKKIVEGRVNKLLGQRVLVEQPFVKNPDQTITDLLADLGKQLGDPQLKVVRFTRYLLGEGIEKKESNFAEEVAAAAGAR